MSKVLLTFLGRSPRSEGAYRTTRYDFGDGSESESVAYFGWLLQRRAQAERLVIMGTAGSMWDHLFEGDIAFGSDAEELRIELMAAVDTKSVQAEHLIPLEQPLADQLGCEVSLVLIPYCQEEAEQVELLRVMAGHVQPGDEVFIDVTHGFRHLPMLGLLSALHLRVVRDADIKSIWYGAYDPDTGEAPVHNLTGLLHVADWIEALAIYNYTGDYGAFRSVIKGQTGELLADAAYNENINRVGLAKSYAKKALQSLNQTSVTTPAQSLFQSELERRLAWSEGETHYHRQRQLCLEYLENERFLEAALGGYEAFVTLLLRERGRPGQDTRDSRVQVIDEYDHERKGSEQERHRYKSWSSLRRLRNALAHGSQPEGREVQAAFSSRKEMRLLLQNTFNDLLIE